MLVLSKVLLPTSFELIHPQQADDQKIVVTKIIPKNYIKYQIKYPALNVLVLMSSLKIQKIIILEELLIWTVILPVVEHRESDRKISVFV